MYRLNILFIYFLLFTSLTLFAQESLPSVKLKAISGRQIDFKDLVNESKDTVMVVSFWATWCIPCISELDNINDEFEESKPSNLLSFMG